MKEGLRLLYILLIKISHDKQGSAGPTMMGAIAVPPWVNEGDYADANDKRHSDILGKE